MKAAVQQACNPQSQVTQERKIEPIIRTRSQAAKALLLERSAEGAGSGPLASQSGTAKAPAPMQLQEIQPEPKERPHASQTGTPGASPPMQLQEIQPEPKKRPLASHSGTAGASPPMQPQEIQPEPKERPHASQTGTPGASPPMQLQKIQPEPKKRPFASHSGTAGASPPMQPQEIQLEPKRPHASQTGIARASPPMQPQEIQPEPKKRPLAGHSGTAGASPPMQPQEIQPEPKKRPLASQTGTAGAFPPMQPQEIQPEPKKRPLASQCGIAGASPSVQPQEIQPEQRPLQGWETEFQEFLEAEEAAWEEQLLMELNPWANTAAFLASFEQVALACRWPRREWVTRLLPSLSEDAEKAFVSLDAKDRGDYRKVKVAILRREALVRDRKRQAFRRFCYQEANGPGEVCARLQELCYQWLKVEQSTKEQILDVVVLEQFMNVLPKEMKNWVKERGPDTCIQAIALAEDFLRRLEAADQGKEQVPETMVGSPPKTGGTQLELAPVHVTPMQFQAKWDEKDSSSTLQNTYPAGYRKTRASKKRKMQLHQYEDTKLRARFPGKANAVFPLLLKQEVAAEDCRRSERLRKSLPVPLHREPSSPPTKVCKKLEKPSLPQGILPDLTKICAECGQCFNGLASFMRHRIVHTGEKRYECCFCGKGFCWRSDLVRHECIHTGKMPHECTYCGQGFDRKWKRKQHEQEHLKSKALI